MSNSVEPLNHAIFVDEDKCIGCSHCMQVCPTEAIRIWHGTAGIHPDYCIDCGECYKACPVSAIGAKDDPFEMMADFPYRVALVPSVLMGQFNENVRTSAVYRALNEIGFDEVYEVEQAVELVNKGINAYVTKANGERPLVSAFCPAVVRLIQIKFPSLVEHIVPVKAPVDVAAQFLRERFDNEGRKRADVGIFYVSPCAAKIASVKSFNKEEGSDISAVFNLNMIFNKIQGVISLNKDILGEPNQKSTITGKSVKWSLTRGEASNIQGKCLAVDGVRNSIEFLEKVENEEVSEIDFLEMRICDESCAGGILTSWNRFLSAARMFTRAEVYDRRNAHRLEFHDMVHWELDLDAHLTLPTVIPRPAFNLSQDRKTALKRMQVAQRMVSYLPGFDCGACGAPSCQALANDIAKENATLSHCVFIQRIMEKQQKLGPNTAIKIIEQIWGRNRLEKQF